MMLWEVGIPGKKDVGYSKSQFVRGELMLIDQLGGRDLQSEHDVPGW